MQLKASTSNSTELTAYVHRGHGNYIAQAEQLIFMGCLHDPAKVQQTSSKCIQNTRWTFAGSCKHPITGAVGRNTENQNVKMLKEVWYVE